MVGTEVQVQGVGNPDVGLVGNGNRTSQQCPTKLEEKKRPDQLKYFHCIISTTESVFSSVLTVLKPIPLFNGDNYKVSSPTMFRVQL